MDSTLVPKMLESRPNGVSGSTPITLVNQSALFRALSGVTMFNLRHESNCVFRSRLNDRREWKIVPLDKTI